MGQCYHVCVPACTHYNWNRMYLLDWSLVAYVHFPRLEEPTTHGTTTLMHPALDGSHRSHDFRAGAIWVAIVCHQRTSQVARGESHRQDSSIPITGSVEVEL